MHRQRLGVIIAAGAGVIASFLPWVHAPIFGSINGIQGDGKITLALFAIALFLALLGNRAAALSGGLQLGAIVSAGLAGVIGIYKIIDFSSKIRMDDDNPIAKAMAQAVGTDIGLYLVVVAGAAVPIVAVIMAKKGSVASSGG